MANKNLLPMKFIQKYQRQKLDKVKNYSNDLMIQNKLISSDTNKTVISHFEVNI